MATTSTILSFLIPEVNSAVDENLWGGYLNTALTTLESEISAKTVDLNFADNVLSRPELKDYHETVVTGSLSSGTWDIDCSEGNHHKITLGADATTLNITNAAPTGKATYLVLEIKQDGTGGHEVTYPSSFKFDEGGQVDITTTANSTSFIALRSTDAGTTWAVLGVQRGFTGL